MDEINKGLDQAYLLHGVTGAGKPKCICWQSYSGKTGDHLGTRNRSHTFVNWSGQSKIGDNVAALHSGLQILSKFEWRRIRSGEVQVAVGARSALFAPFDNVGLIVVDGEHLFL